MSKEQLLKERGWYQWYNPNYWCHEQFAASGVDPTNRGMSTDEAYAFETDESSRTKTLAGMKLYHGAVNALSNMWGNNPQSPTSDVPDAVKYIAIELYDNEIRYDGVTIYRGPYKREDVERIVEREKHKAAPVPDVEIEKTFCSGISQHLETIDAEFTDADLPSYMEIKAGFAALRATYNVTITRK